MGTSQKHNFGIPNFKDMGMGLRHPASINVLAIGPFIFSLARVGRFNGYVVLLPGCASLSATSLL